MGYFEKYRLPVVADVEQCCATGVTAEGKAPRTLVEDMVPLLGERALRYACMHIPRWHPCADHAFDN